MEIIDSKDGKILKALDENARQADSVIAKRVGMSKQVVNYRIRKLLERGIIERFYTVVNVGKLGLDSHYLFLQFQKIGKAKEREILERLHSLPHVGWLVSGTGRWDAILLLFADSIQACDVLLNRTLAACGEHLHEYVFSTLITAEHISYKFLGVQGGRSVVQGEKEPVGILEDEEKTVLEAISQEARSSIASLSEQAGLPAHVVRYRIKKLESSGIIEGYKPKIDVHKVGYQWHLLLLSLQPAPDRRRDAFFSFCKQNDNVYYVTRTIGAYSLMLDVHVRNTEEFKEVLLQLKEHFSDLIARYESVVIFDEHKIEYFPAELL